MLVRRLRGADVGGGRPDGERPRSVFEEHAWVWRHGRWIFGSAWLAYLVFPLVDVFDADHSTLDRSASVAVVAVFAACYLWLGVGIPYTVSRRRTGVAVMLLAYATVCVAVGGYHWIGMYVYCGVCFASAAAGWWAAAGLAATIAVEAGVIVGRGSYNDLLYLALPTLLGAGAVVASRRMATTIVELRRAREIAKRLAASEERLRFARDLHDLLGHSLSLITLKSELAGRLLPDDPDGAARQVADIERVSRQALVDVREAVGGYRRPTIPVELATAETALKAAGIEASVGPEVAAAPGRLPVSAEAALAWALREAVTNVVRHSGARRCSIRLIRDGALARLVVENDRGCADGREADTGDAAPLGPIRHGNGLNGLAERLALEGGRLEANPTARGYRLVAEVAVGGVPSSL